MSILNFKWLARFILFLNWKFKAEEKEELVCPHCGGPLKHHAWSDCTGDRAMLHTMSTPVSAKAKAFYDSIGQKARKTEDPDPLHGAGRISTAYRGPGGSTITE